MPTRRVTTMNVQIHDLEINTDDVNIVITDNTRSYKVSDMTACTDNGKTVELGFGDNVTVCLSKPEVEELINVAASAISALEVVPADGEQQGG
jgi:hypothetical protein